MSYFVSSSLQMKTFESPMQVLRHAVFWWEIPPLGLERGWERERAEEGPIDEKGRILPTA